MSNHAKERCTVQYEEDVVSEEVDAIAVPLSSVGKPLRCHYRSVDEMKGSLQLPIGLLNVGRVTELTGHAGPYAFEKWWLESKGFAEAD